MDPIRSALVRSFYSHGKIRKISTYFGWKMHLSGAMIANPINPGPAVPRYALLLQTVWIQISWLLKKPTDLDLHCLSLSM